MITISNQTVLEWIERAGLYEPVMIRRVGDKFEDAETERLVDALEEAGENLARHLNAWEAYR